VIRLRRQAASALVAVLLCSTAGVVAPVAATQPGTTGAFIDGWTGLARPYVPRSFEGEGSLVAHPTNDATAFFETGPGESDPTNFLFSTGDGSDLTVGSYSTTGWTGAQIGAVDCSQPQAVEFEVLEIERDQSGNIVEFAADFEASCSNWVPALPSVAYGSVRFLSTVGFHAFRATPLRDFAWKPDATIDPVAVGDEQTTDVFTVTNTGSVPTAIGVSDPSDDDVDLESSSCDGDPVDPESACTITVRFEPSTPGPQTTQLTLLTPDLRRSQRPLRIDALGTTTTSVTVTVDPMWNDEGASDQGQTRYEVELDPPGAIGSIALATTCGISRFGSTPGAFVAVTPLGPCDAWATFTGNIGSGYGDSSSEVVQFVQPARSAVHFSAVGGPWITGFPVPFRVWVEGVNGPEPTEGTLALVDASTSEVLGSIEVTAGNTEFEVDVATMTGEPRMLRATYTGSATMVGASKLVAWQVEVDSAPPSLSIHPDDFTGWTQEPTTTLVLNASDVGLVVDAQVSNDGVTWQHMAFTDSLVWSLVDPAYGGHEGDGLRTIRAKVRDAAGNWSAIATWGLTLDRDAPTGSVTIEDGDQYADSQTVALSLAGVDAVSPIDKVELSNDGTTWTTRTYAANQTWTLAPGAGSKTVRVRWRDKAGNWSPIKSDKITLDTTAPTVTVPDRRLISGTSIDAGRIAFRTSWAGSDATSGIKSYQLQQQTDGGAWTNVGIALTATAVDRSLLTQHTYRFRVRATDKAGNIGAWKTGPVLTLGRVGETSTRITYTGSWSTASSSSYWGGGVKFSSAVGARASVTVTGRSIAWVALRGPTRGRAEVFVNGTKVSTIDLYSPAWQGQQVVWTGAWATSQARTVAIRVVGTTGRPRVDIDAFVTVD